MLTDFEQLPFILNDEEETKEFWALLDELGLDKRNLALYKLQ